MEKMIKEKGITLIALIVTIIVLLILAGVTIVTLTGENGIIERTRWTKFVSEYREKEELVELYITDQKINNYGTKNKVTSRAGEREIEEKSEESQKIKKYPVDEKVEVTELENNKTLIETIKKVKQKEEIDINILEIYWISDDKLQQKEDKEKYVIDIEDGKLYKWKGEKIYKNTWHIPEVYVNSEGEAGDNEEEQQEELLITPSKISLEYGQTQEIKAKLGEKDIEISKILWETIDEEEFIDDIGDYEEGEEPEEKIEENDYEDDVISIKDGIVVGEAEGETQVKAIYYKDGKVYSTYLNVEVRGEEIIATTNIQADTMTVNRGKKKVVIVKKDGKRMANRNFTWTTENENVAKAGKYGGVTGVSGTINNGQVKIIGTYKKDESIKVECEVTVQELTSFTPKLSIVGRNLITLNNIDKKYGMKYYTYKINGEQVKKTTSKKYTAKNIVEVNTTYKVEVIVSNGKYKVSSGEVEITSPKYCAGMEIYNISPYGYDIYIYEVSDLVGKINFVVTTNSGTSKTITAEKVEDKNYYVRVNVSEFNNQAGTYTVKARLYNTSNVNVEEITQNCDIPLVNTTVTNITAESLVQGVRNNNIPDGYCDMTVNGKIYNLEVINIKDSKIYDKDKDTYSIRNLIVGTHNQSRTAVIKCNGNLEINGTVTTGVGTIDGYENLTKVKGLFICTAGKLTNNGTISMTARGTYNTKGEDVYLWKNEDNTYEYVPAVGGNGGSAVTSPKKATVTSGKNGNNGENRQTGGGGSGAVIDSSNSGATYRPKSGAGSVGTSYSGGSGGGGSSVKTGANSTDSAESGGSNGGSGGNGNASSNGDAASNHSGGGGAGNPGGLSQYGKNNNLNYRSSCTGTGGLLIIYADIFENNSKVESNGKEGYQPSYNGYASGGSSGGGSINIFYKDSIINSDTISSQGGKGMASKRSSASAIAYSGAGGNGCITYKKIN